MKKLTLKLLYKAVKANCTEENKGPIVDKIMTDHEIHSFELSHETEVEKFRAKFCTGMPRVQRLYSEVEYKLVQNYIQIYG